jgi:hypothetical protein
MKITATGFDDLLILEPKVNGDERGYFMESYNLKTLSELGITTRFIQDNQSRSKKVSYGDCIIKMRLMHSPSWFGSCPVPYWIS